MASQKLAWCIMLNRDLERVTSAPVLWSLSRRISRRETEDEDLWVPRIPPVRNLHVIRTFINPYCWSKFGPFDMGHNV